MNKLTKQQKTYIKHYIKHIKSIAKLMRIKVNQISTKHDVSKLLSKIDKNIKQDLKKKNPKLTKQIIKRNNKFFNMKHTKLITKTEMRQKWIQLLKKMRLKYKSKYTSKYTSKYKSKHKSKQRFGGFFRRKTLKQHIDSLAKIAGLNNTEQLDIYTILSKINFIVQSRYNRRSRNKRNNVYISKLIKYGFKYFNMKPSRNILTDWKKLMRAYGFHVDYIRITMLKYEFVLYPIANVVDEYPNAIPLNTTEQIDYPTAYALT